MVENTENVGGEAEEQVDLEKPGVQLAHGEQVAVLGPPLQVVEREILHLRKLIFSRSGDVGNGALQLLGGMRRGDHLAPPDVPNYRVAFLGLADLSQGVGGDDVREIEAQKLPKPPVPFEERIADRLGHPVYEKIAGLFGNRVAA